MASEEETTEKNDNISGTAAQVNADAYSEAARKDHDQRAAKEQIDAMLNRSRPKTLRQGVAQGVSSILGGALGAAGIAVITPFVSASAGSKKGGIIGGVFGFTGGIVVGAVGAITVAVGSTLAGVTSIVRGVFAVPGQLTQPWRGKYWDEIDGAWIASNLIKEKERLKKIPENDEDILGKARKRLDDEAKRSSSAPGDVKDTKYYDVLEVGPTAEQKVIKCQYYKLARIYHPDKVDNGDEIKAASKFALISEAYQVLSDDELRKEYDTNGLEGLSGDRTKAISKEQIDASILFTFLFGSDKFYDIFGTLAVATSASIGDDMNGISISDARKLQKRRCARLAIKLAESLAEYVNGNADETKRHWKSEAEVLVMTSYGDDLLNLVGKAYTLSSAQFLGSLESGIGMPSIYNWAKSCEASSTRKQGDKEARANVVSATYSVAEVSKGTSTRTQDEADEEALSAILKLMWATTAIDVTNTIHETCQILFFDKSVDSTTRRLRAEGVKELGEIFIQTSETRASNRKMSTAAKEMYDDAAFVAVLETIARKEEATFEAKA